ncbi:MAG: hypothetical protein FRX49_00596 [Trebouxia sp. A1-2]|nr:MAG: hypothetical protein FRX49_00596 [Trebouxia sp. A1-2]
MRASDCGTAASWLAVSNSMLWPSDMLVSRRLQKEKQDSSFDQPGGKRLYQLGIRTLTGRPWNSTHLLLSFLLLIGNQLSSLQWHPLGNWKLQAHSRKRSRAMPACRLGRVARTSLGPWGQAELGTWTDLSASAIIRAGRLNRLDRAVLLRCSSFLWL